MKIKVLMFLTAVFTVMQVSAELNFSTVNYQNSDVNFKPAFPVAGQGSLISVRLRNTGDIQLPPAMVTVKDADGKIVAEGKSEIIPARGATILDLDYQPERNGYQQLTVEAATGGKVLKGEITAVVLSRKQFFPWFGGTEPGDKNLRYANVVLVHKKEQAEYWNSRGAITCLGKSTVNENSTAETYAQYLSKGIKEAGTKGIMIDEIGHYCEFEIREMPIFQGLKMFGKKNRDTFTAVWLCGALKEGYCNITKNPYRREGIDLLLIECYANYVTVEFASPRRYQYFDQRIEMARQQDILRSTVMTLGIVGHEDKFPLTSYELEDEVRYCKRNAPEMPGIGFFHSFGPNKELTSFVDDLCRKYYIEPVVQIYPEDVQTSPAVGKSGQPIKVYVRILNLGAMDAAGVSVDIFINGKKLKNQTVAIKASGEKEYFAPAAVEAEVTLEPGYHELRVELTAPDKVTILDGRVVKTVTVR